MTWHEIKINWQEIIKNKQRIQWPVAADIFKMGGLNIVPLYKVQSDEEQFDILISLWIFVGKKCWIIYKILSTKGWIFCNKAARDREILKKNMLINTFKKHTYVANWDTVFILSAFESIVYAFSAV